jgi:hypothetical protein
MSLVTIDQINIVSPWEHHGGQRSVRVAYACLLDFELTKMNHYVLSGLYLESILESLYISGYQGYRAGLICHYNTNAHCL